jgi:DnaJ like chaperone protein
MATLAAYYSSFASIPLFRGMFEQKQSVVTKQAPLAHESAAFTHALVALAAKLAVVDGQVTKAEYYAFQALFLGGASQADRLRSQFVKHLEDRSTALQFARQILSMTQGNAALHRDLLQRLLSIATADAALNAAEMEMLRAIADVFGVSREEFKSMVAMHMVPAKSPYAVLGVTSSITDEELRARYMAQVQKMHPDRYLAAGASPETVSLLSDQLAALNAAYQQIRASRAKKHGARFGLRNMKGAKAVAA